jgi:hypothetical protein
MPVLPVFIWNQIIINENSGTKSRQWGGVSASFQSRSAGVSQGWREGVCRA